jgi:hypothetical protein
MLSASNLQIPRLCIHLSFLFRAKLEFLKHATLPLEHDILIVTRSTFSSDVCGSAGGLLLSTILRHFNRLNQRRIAFPTVGLLPHKWRKYSCNL